MSEMTPGQARPAKGAAPVEGAFAERYGAGPTDYPYVDQTAELIEPPTKKTEASLAELNPAFNPKSAKPEALWGEAEQAGAEGPSFSYGSGWK